MKRMRGGVAAAVLAALAGAQCLGQAAQSRPDEAITGVQPAALDQPRIYMQLFRPGQREALSVKVDKDSTAAIEAFLDTGASGIVLADNTTKGLKVQALRTADGQKVQFADVGVGGSEEFGVSEPLLASFAPYSSNTDGDNPGSYGQPVGPLRMQLKPAGGLLEQLTGGLDVAGMPAQVGKVVVIDCRPVKNYDKLKTWLLPPDSKYIPKTPHVVPLTYVSFARFTQVEPAGSAGPTLAPNPMIGPDPFVPGDSGKAVLARFRGKSTGMTMLLDTGAACSMISKKKAAELGVRYSPDGKSLVGIPADQQFSLAVGGIGGSKSSCGFYLDILQLPATEGQPVTFAKAPVLVSDITVADGKTGKQFTLDGVFGMNYMVASANVTGGLMPDLGKIVDGPFQFVVIDHVHKFLGLR